VIYEIMEEFLETQTRLNSVLE